APAPQPGSAIHQATPRARGVNGPARGEGGQVDRAAVVEAEVPVTPRVAGPERVRAAQHNGDRPRHGGEHVYQFSEGPRQVSHGSVRRVWPFPSLRRPRESMQAVVVTVRARPSLTGGLRCPRRLSPSTWAGTTASRAFTRGPRDSTPSAPSAPRPRTSPD